MADLTLDLDLIVIPTTADVCDSLPSKTSKLAGIKPKCNKCVSFQLDDNKEETYEPANKSPDAYPGLFYYKDGTKTEKVSVDSSSSLTGIRATKVCMMDLKSAM